MGTPEVLYSRSGVHDLAARLSALGARRVLVLSTPSRRYVDDVTRELAAFDPVVFDRAQVHVPAEIVAAAAVVLRGSGADTIVTVGGGSVTGLGKALRLSHDARFIAIPTTYAGSELTSVYGITTGADKQTGRDERVRPDLVLYDVALTRDIPIALTVQSLLNSFAHVASVGAATGGATSGVAVVLRAIEDLLLFPRAMTSREHALRGAAECARALDEGTPGAQHALAHLLGGALRVDHAALHAALLPHFLAHLRRTEPARLTALETAVDRTDLDAYVHDLLVRAGAPVALTALGATRESLEAALARRPELPGELARDALHGLRPSGRGGRLEVGPGPAALLTGPPPGEGRSTVLALHGRGAEAGTITRRMREIFGNDITVVGLRAPRGDDRWYGVRYGDAGAGQDPEVLAAIDRVEMALATLPENDVILAGFSQGACLALEVAARTKRSLRAVFAPAGARIGRPAEWAEGSVATAIVLGVSDADRWIDRRDVDATVAWFQRAGATVRDVRGPGERHEITLRQRLAAWELLARGTPPSGLGNTFEAETVTHPGAIPKLHNSPRIAPYGLYAEQVNGTAFTAPRAENLRTWMYRVRPSSQRTGYTPLAHATLVGSFDDAPTIDLCAVPPLPEAEGEHDFVDGLVTICGAGKAAARRGYAVHLYSANRSMEHRAFYDADGDLVILPHEGALTIVTELGPLHVGVGHVALIPRGIAFSVLLEGPRARGYVGESFGAHFKLPDRGLVGANGLADARHFRAPHAWFEDRLDPGFRIVGKLGGVLHEARQDHSPFDVVGWHGNYAPFVYDLDAFGSVGNTRWDHGDPSINTVLSAPDAIDLITFPPRWDATTGTFRPPFFHRNVTAEINGILREPASTPSSPFQVGCVFITPPLTPHGVSGRAVEHSRRIGDEEANRPISLGGPSLWFQFESAAPPVLTPWARAHGMPDWGATWGSHRSYFDE